MSCLANGDRLCPDREMAINRVAWLLSVVDKGNNFVPAKRSAVIQIMSLFIVARRSAS